MHITGNPKGKQQRNLQQRKIISGETICTLAILLRNTELMTYISKEHRAARIRDSYSSEIGQQLKKTAASKTRQGLKHQKLGGKNDMGKNA